MVIRSVRGRVERNIFLCVGKLFASLFPGIICSLSMSNGLTLPIIFGTFHGTFMFVLERSRGGCNVLEKVYVYNTNAAGSFLRRNGSFGMRYAYGSISQSISVGYVC